MTSQAQSGEALGASSRWWVAVPEGVGAGALSRRLLGLTFFERRLREASKQGVSHVHVQLPAGLDRDALPSLDDPSLCAPWSVADRAAPPVGATPVELFAILDPARPQVSALRLEPEGDWGDALRWYRRRIVETTNAGWVAKHVNKPVSLAISTRLASTPITPNQWSWFNLAVGIASGWVVAQQGYLAVVLGAFLFQLASIFDGVDGEIAKFRLEYSRFGAWLDTFVDNASLVLFLIGCGVHLFRFSALDPMVLGAWASVAAVTLTAYLTVQMQFCISKLGNASLAVWMGQYVRNLPQRDPAVRFVLLTGRALQKDFFSLAFFVIALTGRLEILLFGGTIALVTALCCALYLNYRYVSLANEHRA